MRLLNATWVTWVARTAWLLTLLANASANAQLYKWVAPDGSVTYSDTPPPATAAKVERKSYGGGSSLAGLPYELAEVARANPVSLYTMANCSACDAGRRMLGERGIPFAEKTVTSNEDIDRVRQLTGATQMPVLVVGRIKQTGFEAGQWGGALTAAGYPATSQLPANYTNPPPEPAAPKATAGGSGDTTTSAAAQQQGIVNTPPPLGNAPPGFQF
ncbi:MAG: glutaredoxin family protein [Burkholderiaceae bacterium]|nr:glutaredoxin family protein [Burkholderiaceae bacterium]